MLGCRSSSIKALFTRQPFSMQYVLYTLLSCLQYEMDTCIYTTVVPKAKQNKNACICVPAHDVETVHGI